MLQSMLNRVKTILSWLVLPHSRIIDEEDRAQSRLLAGMQLVTFVVGVFILGFVIHLDPDDLYRVDTQAGIVFVVGILGLYIVNRLGYLRLSAASYILLSLAVFLAPPYIRTTAPWFLAFSIIPVMLTGFFYPMKWVIAVAVFLLGITFALNRAIIDDLNFWTYQNLWYFQLAASAVIITLVVHMNAIERIRRGKLEEANRALRDSQAELQKHHDNLEELVMERTKELREANRKLEALTRMKDTFVSNVSHELRTPITNMKIYHRLLALKADQREKYHQTLGREIDRLGRLIEDLLHLSRLDQEQAELQLEPVELSMLARQYVEDRRLLAHEHGLELVLVESPEPILVMADMGLLGQVIGIFLTNAINYTPAGGKISASVVCKKAEDKQWCGVCVEDTGPGISAKDKPHLFERFYRGEAGRKSGASGTGLGLAIAQEIVHRHRGSIEVNSEGVQGKGTALTIWLPEVEA